MYIIIKGADFSAKSIKTRTDLPYNPIAETEAYMNAIPTTFATLTEGKKKAVDKFFRTLKDNNLLGGTKITRMYLPKFGRVDGGINLVTPSQNLNFPSANATYTNNGVQFVQGWSSGIPFTKNNSSYGFFNTTARSTAEGDELSIGIGVSGSGLWLGRRISTGNLAGLLITSALTRLTVPNRSFSTGLVQTSISPTVQYAMVDGEITSATQSYTDTATGTLVFSHHTNGSTNAGLFNGSVGFYYVANSALSQVEMAILNSEVNKLINIL